MRETSLDGFGVAFEGAFAPADETGGSFDADEQPARRDAEKLDVGDCRHDGEAGVLRYPGSINCKVTYQVAGPGTPHIRGSHMHLISSQGVNHPGQKPLYCINLMH